jgi:uncharacterized protein YdiU (UPF0061 family)
MPNTSSREVRSGHFVPVKPTPLPEPALVIRSAAMCRELGLDPDEPFSERMVRFLGADSVSSFFSFLLCMFRFVQQSAIPEFDFCWATPYALAIYGSPMYQQCVFGNGRGYGDGRAISVAEVLLDNGRRWELQLKGAGGVLFVLFVLDYFFVNILILN